MPPRGGFRSGAVAECDRLARAAPGWSWAVLRVVEGRAGLLAGRARAATPAGQLHSVRAGVVDVDGAEFGVVVGVGEPGARPTSAAELAQGAAEVLTGQLRAYRSAEAQRRAADLRLADAEADPETGLGGARFWRRLLDAEQARCQELAHPAGVVLLTAVGRPGGSWAGVAARTLAGVVRSTDALARTAEDRFAVLACECGPTGLAALASRLGSRMLEGGVVVRTGSAARPWPDGLLADAVRAAEAELAGPGPGPRILHP